MNKLLIFITVLLASFQLKAQLDTTKQVVPELPGDEVEVIKDFQARLAETQMLRIIPQSPVVKTVPLSYNYNVGLRKLDLDYLPPVIRPVALPSPEKEEINNTLLQFAYGYPRLSEGLAVTNYRLNDKLDVGLRFKHLASSHQERLPSGFYRNDGHIYANYRLSNGLKVRGAIDLAFDKNEILTREDELRNDRYDNTYGVNIGIGKDLDSEGKIHYDAGISFSQFRVNDLVLTSFTENNFSLSAEASYIDELWRGGLKTKFWNTNTNADSLGGYNAIFLDPYGIYSVSKLKVDAGITAIFAESTKVYPQVEISYAVKGNKLVGKAFAQTRFNRNNHENTYAFNPFIQNLNQYGIAREMQFGVGIAGRLEKWSYGMDVYYSLHEDIQEFRLNSLADDYVYGAEMIEGNALNFRLNGSYNVKENIRLHTSLLYRNLSDSLANDILGYYDMEWEIGGDLKFLNNKFAVGPKASFYLFNPLQNEDSDANFIDLQLDLAYNINSKISIYAKGFNLLNRRNARWQGYDALGISAMGGVRVVF